MHSCDILHLSSQVAASLPLCDVLSFVCMQLSAGAILLPGCPPSLGADGASRKQFYATFRYYKQDFAASNRNDCFQI